MAPGEFIEPDTSLADLPNPNSKLGIPIYSGHRAYLKGDMVVGRNRFFDSIADRLSGIRIDYEDQCTALYYFDLVRTLRDLAGEFTRVVEVGVYMGGASAVLGGCIERFDFDLDLVDINADFLRFAHERIRRAFPESAHRVRLFHGDVPSYVAKVLKVEDSGPCIIHHDGAHDFNQVVKDLAALSFVREKLYAVIAQDTHLRGTIKHMNFVDMALYAVFGTDLAYAPIGQVYEAGDDRTRPNKYQGNYFMPGVAEGVVLPMAANHWHYPHPSMQLEAFL